MIPVEIIRESLKVTRAQDRLLFVMKDVRQIAEVVDEIREIDAGDLLEPELRAIEARLMQIAQHVQSSSDVLAARIDNIFDEYEVTP